METISNMFLICGVSIPFSEIKNYSLVQREYIYRPSYKDVGRLGIRYKFDKMVPYAGILTDSEYRLANRKMLVSSIPTEIASSIISTVIGGAPIRDVAAGLTSGVIDTVSSIVGKEKYYCMTVSGRTFVTSLEAVPTLLISKNGQIMEADKKERKRLFQDANNTATILTTKALSISAKVNYLFYGNGIQLVDADSEYLRLLAEYSAWQTHQQSQNQSGKPINTSDVFFRNTIGKIISHRND